MTNEQINCPVMMAAKRSVVPRRPTRSTGASTLNAPSSPPVQTHQGVPWNCAAVGHFERTTTWKSKRLAADTKADTIEAQSGAPPALAAKFRLTAAWTTNEPPITKPRKRRTKCMGRQLRRAQEFKQGSPADRVYFSGLIELAACARCRVTTWRAKPQHKQKNFTSIDH
jgi:hypothetical protein